MCKETEKLFWEIFFKISWISHCHVQGVGGGGVVRCAPHFGRDCAQLSDFSRCSIICLCLLSLNCAFFHLNGQPTSISECLTPRLWQIMMEIIPTICPSVVRKGSTHFDFEFAVGNLEIANISDAQPFGPYPLALSRVPQRWCAPLPWFRWPRKSTRRPLVERFVWRRRATPPFPVPRGGGVQPGSSSS